MVAAAHGLNADTPALGCDDTHAADRFHLSPRPRAGAAVRMSRLAIAVLVAAALLGVIRVGAAGADVGVRDFSYTDLNGVQVPTEDKPQSKLWFHDGSWWGLLYSPVEHATVIERLDASTQTWVDTGTVVDSRRTARADVLWDGQKLYVGSGTTVVSEFGSPPNPEDVSAGSAQLSRFSYDPLTRSYVATLDFR